MKPINLIFPNQLFKKSELLNQDFIHFIIEETLFFNHYNFHKQKLFFHRCSMKNYYDFLKNKNFEVFYINSYEDNSDIRKFIKNQANNEVESIKCIDPEDNYLERRLKESCKKQNIKIQIYNNPAFINTKEDLSTFFRKDKKKLFQTSFYKSERVRLNILLESNQKPVGGKWTYDELNREKYPKNKETPKIEFSTRTKNHKEALGYVNKYFNNNNVC